MQGRAGSPESDSLGPTSDPNGGGFGVLLYRLIRGITTALVYREALPSLTVLTGRSAGGLGRSLERPCKWSAALSAV